RSHWFVDRKSTLPQGPFHISTLPTLSQPWGAKSSWPVDFSKAYLVRQRQPWRRIVDGLAALEQQAVPVTTSTTATVCYGARCQVRALRRPWRFLPGITPTLLILLRTPFAHFGLPLFVHD